MNLGHLEERINNDPRLREEFLKDPDGVLRREGLTLSPDQERRLHQSVAKVISSKPPVGAATITKKIGIIMEPPSFV